MRRSSRCRENPPPKPTPIRSSAKVHWQPIADLFIDQSLEARHGTVHSFASSPAGTAMAPAGDRWVKR